MTERERMIKKIKGADDCINYINENGCRCLIDEHCFGKCKFYKTKEQQAKDIEKVFARLRRLPSEWQTMIAEKYYNRTPVWKTKKQSKRM